jgi:uncharacterized membrane protein YfcA
LAASTPIVAAAAIVAIVLVGAAAQSALGFGFGLLTVPVLSLIEPDLVPGPSVVFGGIALVALMLEEHGGADWGFVGWATVGRLPGSLLAAALLAALSRSALTVVLSLLVIAAVAMSLGGWRVPGSRPAFVGAGVLSGLMGTVASIGGPPLLLTLQDRPAPELRASVGGASVIGAALSIAVLVGFGEMGADEWRLVALLLPAVLAGIVVGRHARAALAVGIRARVAVYAVSLGGALWSLATAAS